MVFGCRLNKNEGFFRRPPALDVVHLKNCVFAAGDEISARQTVLVLLLRLTQAERNESGAFPDFLTGHAGAQLPLIGHRFSEKRLGSRMDQRRLQSHFLSQATVTIRSAFTNSKEALYLVLRTPHPLRLRRGHPSK